MNPGDDLQSAEVVQVIRTTHLRGTGAIDNPLRKVVTHWSLSGALLAECDPSTETAQ